MKTRIKKPKILLLHGWNYINYNSCFNSQSYIWKDECLSELEKYFTIEKLVFPGFLGKKEPQKKEWNLDDYSDFVFDFLKENKDIEYILGFSFGGAVALNTKDKFNLKQKLILISPAIFRKTSNKNIKKPNFVNKVLPKFVVDFLRKIYLTHIVKNPFYKYGSSFLKRSYLNIVRVDLRNVLVKKYVQKDIFLIFGDSDTATNHKDIEKVLDDKSNFFVIKNAGHKVFEEKTREVVDIIKMVLRK